MKQRLIRILIWLGIMSILTVFAMVAWMMIWGGTQTTDSLKWLQFLQTIATFLLPSILCAWLWDEEHKPFRWLRMDVPVQWKEMLLAIVIMVCAVPGINLLADLNSRVELPKSLEFIEQILKSQEEAAAALTERFLQADNIGGLLVRRIISQYRSYGTFTCFVRGIRFSWHFTTNHIQGSKWQGTKYKGASGSLDYGFCFLCDTHAVLRIRTEDVVGGDVRICICLERKSLDTNYHAFCK